MRFQSYIQINKKNLNRLKIIAIILICFTTKSKAQSVLSKVWHNTVSHYNYYYNASVLITEAEDNTTLAYKDNFKDVLSLYPIGDEASLKGNSAKMDEVLKKCSHIIDKHNKSKWVDDSYLQMGNAQFYKGDFYAAIEVYEYVASNFKKTIPAAKAEINLLLTYIQLKKYDDAEALYTKLNNKKDFPEQLKNSLNIAGAAINIKQKKYQVAIKLLEISIPKVKNKPKKIRYNFVLAQLYALSKKNTDALERYKKVVRLNPPYEFAFNAKLNMAKAINTKNRGEVREAMATLRTMLKDDKNIDYFDQIYYELGNLELADKNESQAIVEYSNCLRSKTNDPNIKSMTYLALADLYFKKQDYLNAQVYYDSSARSTDKYSPEYANITAKNQILNELIKHLLNIKEKDSLLRLADNKKLMEKTIDNLIKEEKQKAEEKKQLEERQKIQQQLVNQASQAPTSSTNFPFYNQTAKAKGLQDFQRIWGNRELAEYWAISSNKTAALQKFNDAQEKDDPGSEEKRKLLEDMPDERKKYYYSIPFTIDDKQKMRDEISESYFLGANVYYQSLKENEKAKKMLEEMLTRFPKSKYEINAWYLLARISKEQGKMDKYDYYTDLIRKADPKSNFLNVLEQNASDTVAKTTTVDKADDEVELLYSKTFTAYKSQKFADVLALKKENDLKYTGNPLQVNFDYLEALSIGQQGDLVNFEKKLQAIVDNYPQTEIGKQADLTLQILKAKNAKNAPKVESKGASNSPYKYNESDPHFYMLVVPKNINLNQIKTILSGFNKSQFSMEDLQITSSLIGSDYQTVVVNNFSTLAKVKEYLTQIKSNTALFADVKDSNLFQNFIISQDNFGILIGEKILDNYLLFYKSTYPY